MNKNALLIFAKAPIPGIAKTRLIPALGEIGAAKLHEKLALHTLDSLLEPSHWDSILWCASELEHEFFQYCTAHYQLPLEEQQGSHLGLRLFHALETSLASYESVCIVGTDCPVLDKSTIVRAFEKLQHADVVFSPAEDGGYVLLAAKKVDASLFDDIHWGTEKVLRQSLDKIHKLEWQCEMLPTLWDVDIADDLMRDEMRQFIEKLEYS